MKTTSIAFAKEDERPRDFLKGQSLLTNTPFEYIDMSGSVMKTTLFFILLFFCSFVWGQNEKNLTNELAKRLGEMQKAEVKQEIDKRYLIRGLLQHSPYSNLECCFYTFEQSLITYVKENLIAEDVAFETDTVKNLVRFKKLEEEITSYSVGNWNFVTAKSEKNKVFSFLAGCIIRFGEIIDDETCYIVLPTLTQVEACQNALMVTGCQKYFYEMYDHIPASYRICFKVTDEMKYYLEECNTLIESYRKDKKSYSEEKYGLGVYEGFLESQKIEKKKIIELISN